MLARVIIPCGSAKLDTAEMVPAFRLYTGGLFRALWATAITLSNDVYILSAGYGLLRASDLVLPYDYKMTPRKALWLRQHSPSLAGGGLWPQTGHLCPKTYAGALPAACVALLPPGLKMGYMMQAAVALRGPAVLWQEPARGNVAPMLPPNVLAL